MHAPRARLKNAARVAALAVVLAWLASLVGSLSAATLAPAPSWQYPVVLGTAFAACASCVLASRRAGNRRARVAWMFQASGCALWTLAPILWWHPPPVPVAPEVGGALCLGCVSVGCWLVARAKDRRARIRMLLDGATGATALFVVEWALVLGPIRAEAGHHAARIIPHLVLSTLAAVLCSWNLFLLYTEFQQRHRSMLTFLTAGIGAMGLAELHTARFEALSRLDRPGSVTAWGVGFAFVATAGWVYRGTTRRVSTPGTAGWVVYTPYALIIPATMTVLAQLAGDGRVPAPELVACGVLVLLVLGRQLLLLEQNRDLVALLSERERQLQHLAFSDPLTGLGNRAFLRRVVEEDPAAADGPTGMHGPTGRDIPTGRDDLRPISLVFCDLDDFKSVNDTLGHHAGDELLVRVAERLRDLTREVTDTVVRMGGDEFAVLVRSGPQDATGVARRIWEGFQQPFLVEGRPLVIGASIGLVHEDALPSGDSNDVDQLLRSADLAMYAAKRGGKNAVRLWGAGQANLFTEGPADLRAPDTSSAGAAEPA